MTTFLRLCITLISGLVFINAQAETLMQKAMKADPAAVNAARLTADAKIPTAKQIEEMVKNSRQQLGTDFESLSVRYVPTTPTEVTEAIKTQRKALQEKIESYSKGQAYYRQTEKADLADLKSMLKRVEKGDLISPEEFRHFDELSVARVKLEHSMILDSKYPDGYYQRQIEINKAIVSAREKATDLFAKGKTVNFEEIDSAIKRISNLSDLESAILRVKSDPKFSLSDAQILADRAGVSKQELIAEVNRLQECIGGQCAYRNIKGSGLKTTEQIKKALGEFDNIASKSMAREVLGEIEVGKVLNIKHRNGLRKVQMVASPINEITEEAAQLARQKGKGIFSRIVPTKVLPYLGAALGVSALLEAGDAAAGEGNLPVNAPATGW